MEGQTAFAYAAAVDRLKHHPHVPVIQFAVCVPKLTDCVIGLPVVPYTNIGMIFTAPLGVPGARLGGGWIVSLCILNRRMLPVRRAADEQAREPVPGTFLEPHYAGKSAYEFGVIAVGGYPPTRAVTQR